MSFPISVRRLAAVVLPAALLVTGAPLLSGVAQANHSISGVNPGGSVNNVTAVVDVFGNNLQPSDTVTLRRHNVPSDTIQGTNSVTQSSTTTLRSSFDLAMANPGAYDVVVSRAVDGERVCASCFTITSTGTPTVSAITRQSQGDPGEVTIRGTNFTKSSGVQFLLDGEHDPALTFARDSGTQNVTTINGVYTPGAGFVGGLYDVRVVGTDGLSGTCENCFRQPKIVSVTPNQLGQGATNQTVYVDGVGFTGATLSSLGNDITINSQTLQNDGRIALNLTVRGDAAATSRTFTVTHPNGGYHTRANSLTINPRPTVSSLSPSSRGQGAQNETINVSGSNFQPGAQFTISPADGVTINSANVINTVTAQLNVSITQSAPTGARSVIVTNPDAGSSTASSAFTVNSGPKVTKVSPHGLNAGTVGNVVTIEGSGFPTNLPSEASDAQVLFNDPNITVVGQPSVSPQGNSLSVTVNVAAGAPGGLRIVSVKNLRDGGIGSCLAPGCIGINTLTSITPSAHTNNGVKSISVFKSGGAFDSGSQVVLVRDGAVNGQGPITGTVTGTSNGGQTLTFTADLNHVAPGAYHVQVTTGSTNDSCTRCFTVTGGVPSVNDEGVNPATGGRGALGLILTLAGQNFANGATVEFVRGTLAAGVVDPDITVVPGSVQVSSLNTMQLRVNIPTNTTNGAVSVRVINPGDPSPSSGGCDMCWTIVDPPSVSAVNPASRGQGSPTVTATITGTNFDSGLKVDFGDGITVGNATVNDGGLSGTDTAQVPITVTSGAATGLRNVVVTNSNGGRATCPNCFTVNAAPTVAAVTPSTGKPNQTVDVQITGTGFGGPAPAPLVEAGPDVTVSNVARVSPTQINARFVVASAPALGPVDIRVTNPDGGTGIGNDLFRIVTVPGAPSIGTATAGDRSATLTWTPPGSNGGTAITGYRIACEPSCTELVVDGSSTQGTVSGLTNGRTYRLKVRAINAAGEGAYSALSNSVLPIGPDGDFVAITPTRVLDTRRFDSPTAGRPLSGGQTLSHRVTGIGTNVPTAGVSAVVMNVTAVSPTATSGHLRVFPGGTTTPNASTLNFTKGKTVPNLVKVLVGSGGRVSVFNSSGQTHVLYDVVGYFLDGTTGTGDKYTSVAPERVFDTRNGSNTANAPLGAVETRTITIADGSPVPTDATAVVINVTVTAPTKSGFLTAFPAGMSRPGSSNLNYSAGQTVANLVAVKLGSGPNQGKLGFFNGSSGTTEVLADVVGYYKSSGGGSQFKPLSPSRILDTRSGAPVAGGSTRDVTVLDIGNVPDSTSVKAVVVNVTAVTPSGSGYLTVYPKGESQPLASTLNFVRSQTVANLAVLKVGTDGKVRIYAGMPTGTNVHVLFDVVGYYV